MVVVVVFVGNFCICCLVPDYFIECIYNNFMCLLIWIEISFVFGTRFMAIGSNLNLIVPCFFLLAPRSFGTSL